MLNESDRLLLIKISGLLNVKPEDLYRLIDFESGFNPQAKNRYSSARGLLQWIDKTAQSLGYADSSDLVNKNPTVNDQLKIVYNYLSRYAPFRDKQALYMSVFYPKAKNWDPSMQFPPNVQKSNPGIKTVSDYVSLVDRKKLPLLPLLLLVGVVLLTIYKRSF